MGEKKGFTFNQFKRIIDERKNYINMDKYWIMFLYRLLKEMYFFEDMYFFLTALIVGTSTETFLLNTQLTTHVLHTLDSDHT